jgi:hypothetical protein
MRVIMSLQIFITLFIPGCKDKSTQPSAASNQFAIYLLKDSSITAISAWSMPQDSLVLAASPFITQNDLKLYIWSSHTFFAQPALDSLFVRLSRQGGKSSGVPFFVTVGSERIYPGAFWWYYSSSLPKATCIYATSMSPHRIQHDSLLIFPDLKSDRRIHDALKSAGILIEQEFYGL